MTGAARRPVLRWHTANKIAASNNAPTLAPTSHTHHGNESSESETGGEGEEEEEGGGFGVEGGGGGGGGGGGFGGVSGIGTLGGSSGAADATPMFVTSNTGTPRLALADDALPNAVCAAAASAVAAASVPSTVAIVESTRVLPTDSSVEICDREMAKTSAMRCLYTGTLNSWIG